MKSLLIKSAAPALLLPRIAKRVVALMVDLSLCVLTVWLAYYLRLGEFVSLSGNAIYAILASIGLASAGVSAETRSRVKNKESITVLPVTKTELGSTPSRIKAS
jgi:hypothetical protein